MVRSSVSEIARRSRSLVGTVTAVSTPASSKLLREQARDSFERPIRLTLLLLCDYDPDQHPSCRCTASSSPPSSLPPSLSPTVFSPLRKSSLSRLLIGLFSPLCLTDCPRSCREPGLRPSIPLLVVEACQLDFRASAPHV